VVVIHFRGGGVGGEGRGRGLWMTDYRGAWLLSAEGGLPQAGYWQGVVLLDAAGRVAGREGRRHAGSLGQPARSGSPPAQAAGRGARAGRLSCAGWGRLRGWVRLAGDEFAGLPESGQAQAMARTLACGAAALGGDGRGLPSGLLAGVAVPVLAVGGVSSAPWLASAAGAVAGGGPGGRRRRLEGGLRAAAPAVLAAAVARFFHEERRVAWAWSARRSRRPSTGMSPVPTTVPDAGWGTAGSACATGCSAAPGRTGSRRPARRRAPTRSAVVRPHPPARGRAG
jgi:hypothetical protein